MSARKNVTYSSHPNHAARSAHAKGDKLFRTYDTTAIRPKRNPVPAVVAVIVLVVALIAIVFTVLNFTRSCTSTQMLPEGYQVEVVVEEGESAKSIAKTLVDKGVLSNANAFVDRVNELGIDGKLQPGVYTVVSGQSVDEIITVMQTPVASATFTIPEGSTISQTAEIVSKASEGRITVEDFVAAASNAATYAGDYPFLAEVGENSLEGFLFPKTYPIKEDSTADSIIRGMLDQFGAETATLDWSYVESRGLSHYDAVKLASIVEKESDEKNRPTVASVFYNRLAIGQSLESDATVAYVVGHDPTPDDIATYNDYNTYFLPGLTPTPINSPSLACLQSVCKPEQTGYYYFYFDENGYSFSETYEDHQSVYGGNDGGAEEVYVE